MDHLNLLKSVQGCQFFEHSLIRENYDNIESLGKYLKSSIEKNLSMLGLLDKNGYMPFLHGKLLYGLLTFFDLYRKDWLSTSYINFWGSETTSNDKKIIESQQDYYRS